MRTLTDKQAQEVNQLRERVADLNLNEEQKSNDFLVRWLIARDHNLAKAEEMLRNSMKWRRENNIDAVMDWVPPDIYRKMYPVEICGYTTDGIPIAIIPAKFFDIDLFWEMDQEEYTKYSFRNLEILIDANRKHSKNGLSTYEFIAIHDLAGLNVRSMMNRKYLNYVQAVSKVFDENYPELIKKAYFTHTPSLFSILFSMVKHFIPKRTVAKFTICGSDPTKIGSHLKAEHIPMEVIPPSYGGLNQEFERTAFKNCGKSSVRRKVSAKGEVETDGFIESIVPAGQKIDFTFEIDEVLSVLHWVFKTEHYDISFFVTFTPEKVNDLKPVPEVIQPTKRVEAQTSMQRGSVVCHKPGIYALIFDNTYSRMRSKTLHLKVDITKPEKATVIGGS